MDKQLIILHSNIQGFTKAKQTLLFNEIKSIKPDIITINETWFTKEQEFSLPNFKIYRKESSVQNIGTGIITLIRDDCYSKLVDNYENENMAHSIIFHPKNTIPKYTLQITTLVRMKTTC
jgi:predicted glycosyltransferase